MSGTSNSSPESAGGGNIAAATPVASNSNANSHADLIDPVRSHNAKAAALTRALEPSTNNVVVEAKVAIVRARVSFARFIAFN